MATAEDPSPGSPITDFFTGPTAQDKLRAQAYEMMRGARDPRQQASIAAEAAAIERGERTTPQYEADLARDEARKAIWRNATELQIDASDPAKFSDIAISTILRQGYPGAERDAALVLQWRHMREAQINAIALQKAKVEEAKNPNKGRGEYYTPVQTADGVFAFDARRGVVVDPATGQPVKGNRVVGSASDPKLQGDISGSKEYGQEVGKAVASIGGKYDALDSLKESQKMLDKGIYSGFWGELQKTMAKATPGVDKAKAANTEQFMAYIGNVVIPGLKEFGGNDSNEELKYLQKVKGGDISMEPEALRRILASSERKITAGIKRLRSQGQSIGKDVPEEAGEPAKPKKPKLGLKEGATATNPNTGERMIYKGGKWQPLK